MKASWRKIGYNLPKQTTNSWWVSDSNLMLYYNQNVCSILKRMMSRRLVSFPNSELQPASAALMFLTFVEAKSWNSNNLRNYVWIKEEDWQWRSGWNAILIQCWCGPPEFLTNCQISLANGNCHQLLILIIKLFGVKRDYLLKKKNNSLTHQQVNLLFFLTGW